MPRFMSRLFGLALLLGVLATPVFARSTTVAQDATPCPPLTEEEAAAWATTWATAINAHDAAGMAALWAPDGIQHWGVGADTEGSDELTAAFDGLFTAFPGIHMTVDRVWLSGDTVVIRWIAIGVQETDYMGIPASQETVTWTGINVFQLECGLVSEGWTEADHFGRIQQQGVLPGASPEATPAA